MTAYCRVYDSRYLQADCQEPNQLRNPTLGRRVWAVFTFFIITSIDVNKAVSVKAKAAKLKAIKPRPRPQTARLQPHVAAQHCLCQTTHNG